MFALEFIRDGIVIAGRGHDRDVVKILGGGTDHGRTADVDVFDQLFERDSGLGSGLFEGVEIHDDHVDGGNAVFGNGGHVLGVIAAVKNPAVNLGVQAS